MTNLYKPFLLVIFAASVLSASYSSYPSEYDPCLAQRRCSFEEFIVRAVDNNKQCLLFRNDCLFLNEVCARRANNQPALEKVEPEACRCTDICPAIHKPVCGEHGGVYTTFPNSCTMNSMACRQNKSLTKVNRAKCQRKCPDSCPGVYSPVCAEYNGAYSTFSNMCTLNMMSCELDKTFMLAHEGACTETANDNFVSIQ
uniref:Kazal-like domain-containing protein n=1 Tax=Stomoxys calcitrans TaxID=35570 RepID=A0A1I8Q7K7_STOCA